MADAMTVGSRTADGVRVRYAESTGLVEPSILLGTPWPESVYAFAPTWSSLPEVARLVAVDLPGFGGSERRGEFLDERLPKGKLVVVEAGHVVWRSEPTCTPP
jgi:hypothetical protein